MRGKEKSEKSMVRKYSRHGDQLTISKTGQDTREAVRARLK
jgi:hypothetical protein